jgi:hypothetical protein
MGVAKSGPSRCGPWASSNNGTDVPFVVHNDPGSYVLGTSMSIGRITFTSINYGLTYHDQQCGNLHSHAKCNVRYMRYDFSFYQRAALAPPTQPSTLSARELRPHAKLGSAVLQFELTTAYRVRSFIAGSSPLMRKMNRQVRSTFSQQCTLFYESEET